MLKDKLTYETRSINGQQIVSVTTIERDKLSVTLESDDYGFEIAISVKDQEVFRQKGNGTLAFEVPSKALVEAMNAFLEDIYNPVMKYGIRE